MTQSPNPLSNLRPLDPLAMDGQFWLLYGSGALAVARWTELGWRYASGRPLEFEPDLYQPK